MGPTVARQSAGRCRVVRARLRAALPPLVLAASGTRAYPPLAAARLIKMGKIGIGHRTLSYTDRWRPFRTFLDDNVICIKLIPPLNPSTCITFHPPFLTFCGRGAEPRLMVLKPTWARCEASRLYRRTAERSNGQTLKYHLRSSSCGARLPCVIHGPSWNGSMGRWPS